jgi:hypothetical protein
LYKSKRLVAALCAASSVALSVPAVAGPYADDMAKCLVKSTSTADRTVFVKWMFASMALHPDVKSMSVVTEQQRDDLNKSAAVMFQHLLLETCRTETQQAIKYEGPETLSYAFQIFGQAAARELFSEPSVAAAMSGLTKYFDKNKLKSLTEPTEAK